MVLGHGEMIGDFRRLKGFDDEAESHIKKLFFDSIIKCHISAFEKFLSLIGSDWADVGSVLQVHRGTVSRWLRGESQPELSTAHLFLSARGIRVEEVGFPHGDDAVLWGTAETLIAIRSKWLGEQAGKIDVARAACLRFALGDPGLRSIKGPYDENRVLDEIAGTIRRSCPSARIESVRDLRILLDEWFIPWVLFCDSIPHSWAYRRKFPNGR